MRMWPVKRRQDAQLIADLIRTPDIPDYLLWRRSRGGGYNLNEVRTGHEVIVRDRNVPIARIVPISQSDPDDELRALAGQGKIRLAEDQLDEAFWDLPAPRVPRDTLRKVLIRERD